MDILLSLGFSSLLTLGWILVRERRFAVGIPCLLVSAGLAAWLMVVLSRAGW